MNVEEEAWGTFRYPVFKIDQGRDTVASRQTTTSNWARTHEKHVRDTEIVTWARGDRRILILGHCCTLVTLLAAYQRTQADSQRTHTTQAASFSFPSMRLPSELGEQVYRELLIRGGRTLGVAVVGIVCDRGAKRPLEGYRNGSATYKPTHLR